MLKLLIPGLVFCAVCFPQTTRRPPPPVKKPITIPKAPGNPATAIQQDFLIEKISVEGVKRYKPDQVIKASGLKVGQIGSKEIFDKAQAQLVEAGVFSTVAYRYQPGASGKSFAVTFEVQELEQVYPVRFEGLPRPDSELRDHLAANDPLFGPLIPATEPVLKRYVKILKDYMNTSDVAAKVVADTAIRLTVVFRSAAAPMTIAEVDFSGTKEIRSEDLRNKIAEVAVGVSYSEARMREILDMQLRPFYEAKGLMRVKWAKISTQPAKDVTGVVVKVEVEEGLPYGLNAVEIHGWSPVKELLDDIKLKTGEVANFDLVEQAKDKILKFVKRKGYMRAAVTYDRVYNDEKHWVAVKYHVVAGQQYTFRALKIEGLDLLSEPPIRKMWGLKEGKAFNAEYPDRFLGEIREQRLFDNLGDDTKARLTFDDRANTITVTLQFKGDAQKKDPIILGVPPPQDNFLRSQSRAYIAATDRTRSRSPHN